MIRYVLAAAFLSTVSTAYGAAPAATDAAETEAIALDASQAEAVSEPEEEKKICRTERVTGSLTRRNRICLTQAQWREVHDRTRRGVDELVGGASGAPRCINAMDAACGAASASGPAPGM